MATPNTPSYVAPDPLHFKEEERDQDRMTGGGRTFKRKTRPDQTDGVVKAWVAVGERERETDLR